ncbi:nucleotidyltransferase domain-containing protein [Thermodesulfovibrionales bacterium]|nr:nucleotidyltransferase domain-containing protein [Thermodesulfovibrionales bacterium]
MNLFVVKYLLLLILEGEMTSREMAESLGDSIYNASHAMGLLNKLGLAIHPENRPRSWIADSTKPLNLTLEKLLLVSKNNTEIQSLLMLPSYVCTGAQLAKKPKGTTIDALINSTSLSKVSTIKTLKKMVELALLRKKTGKPNLYYLSDKPLAQLFCKACSEITDIFLTKKEVKKEKKVATREIIKQIKNDKSVLILVHYGSSARGRQDKLSDIDLFAVTRDKFSRGEIISHYRHKNIDLSVYSKKGFLRLIKTQPDFISNIATARVLKGKDILEAVTQ